MAFTKESGGTAALGWLQSGCTPEPEGDKRKAPDPLRSGARSYALLVIVLVIVPDSEELKSKVGQAMPE